MIRFGGDIIVVDSRKLFFLVVTMAAIFAHSDSKLPIAQIIKT